MYLTDATVHGMLDNALPGGSNQVQLSLHNGYSATGANLVGNKTASTFMVPNGGTAKTFQVDVTNNRIYCENHGLSNDQKVAFFGAAAPGGLTAGVEYFVIGVTAGDPDYFQVSSTQGGSAIDITGQHGDGCMVSRLVPEVYSGAGTHRVNTFVLAA